MVTLRVLSAACALALAAAPLAHAEPGVPAGDYRIQYADGEVGTWAFTPCGPDCTVVNTPGDPFVTNWQFRLADGRWTFSGPNQLSCPSGGSVPIAMVYGFDANTLAGQGQATIPIEICGRAAGTTMLRTVRLTKV